MNGGSPTKYYRSENTQNTVLGISNATGTATMAYVTIDAYGSMGEQEVTADFEPGAVTFVSASPFGSGITRLTLQANALGARLRAFDLYRPHEGVVSALGAPATLPSGRALGLATDPLPG